MLKCDFCANNSRCTDSERYTCVLHNYLRFTPELDEPAVREKLRTTVRKFVPDDGTAFRLADNLFAEGARI